MHLWVSGNKAGVRDGRRRAGEVRHYAAGFAHEEDPRRDVPGREHQFPEGLVASTGDVGEVECRGASATDAGGLPHRRAETAEKVVDLVAVLERESRSDERLDWLGDARDANRLAVASCATSLDGGEE